MATYEKTWTRLWNYVPLQDTVLNQQKCLVWLLIRFLLNDRTAIPTLQDNTSGKWSVVSCSSSLAVDLAGADLWFDSAVVTTPIGFNPARLVNAATATAHSWILLRSPDTFTGGQLWLLVDLNNSGNYAYCFMTLVQSATNPFTGGTTTAAPTTTAKCIIPRTQYQLTLNDAVTFAARKVHFLQSSEGDFHFFISQDGTGLYHTGVSIGRLADARADDQSNVYVCSSYDVSGVWRATPMFTGTPLYMRDIYLRDAIGTQVQGNIVQWASGANELLGTAEMASADSTGKAGDYPAYVYMVTTGYKCLRGRLPDITRSNNALVPGTTDDAVLANAGYSVIGGFWFPTGAVNPSL